VEYLIGFPLIQETISFPFLLGQVEREIPRQNTLHVCRTFIGEMKRISEFFSPKAKRKHDAAFGSDLDE